MRAALVVGTVRRSFRPLPAVASAGCPPRLVVGFAGERPAGSVTARSLVLETEILTQAQRLGASLSTVAWSGGPGRAVLPPPTSEIRLFQRKQQNKHGGVPHLAGQPRVSLCGWRGAGVSWQCLESHLLCGTGVRMAGVLSISVPRVWHVGGHGPRGQSHCGRGTQEGGMDPAKCPGLGPPPGSHPPPHSQGTAVSVVTGTDPSFRLTPCAPTVSPDPSGTRAGSLQGTLCRTAGVAPLALWPMISPGKCVLRKPTLGYYRHRTPTCHLCHHVPCCSHTSDLASWLGRAALGQRSQARPERAAYGHHWASCLAGAPQTVCRSWQAVTSALHCLAVPAVPKPVGTPEGFPTPSPSPGACQGPRH